MSVQLKCGHLGKKKCCQNEDVIQCAEQCARTRPCGHVCHGHACHEHDKKQCVDCVRIEEKQRKDNKLIVEQQIQNVQNDARLYQGVCIFDSY